MSHAILSPSGAERWLNCTPSARLEQQFPDSTREAAKEGTLAHSLCELLLKQKTNRVSKALFNRELKKIQENKFYDNAMQEHCDNYASYVMELFSAAQARTSVAMLFLEQKLDLTEYVPEGFGTGDAVIIADHLLDIMDFKYGKGVPVFADNNKQMMLYALGALKEFDFMYDIHTVRMTIYQPRIDNISSWEIPVTELQNWAETELIDKAKLAFNGEGDYSPGPHCRFCRAKATCKANAEFNLELAKYEFKHEALLSDTDIADILDRADTFKKWIAGVEEFALNESVNNNKKWPRFKLVEGRSNRQYKDEDKVVEILKERSFSEDVIYQPRAIYGISALEKSIGKKLFNSYLADWIIKPPGKPTLVPESDKRPAYNSAESAAIEFSQA